MARSCVSSLLVGLSCLLLAVPAGGYRSGARQNSCLDLEVRHFDTLDESAEDFIPSLTCFAPCPYQLSLVGESTSDEGTYQCGVLHELQLVASESFSFQGYLLQARVSTEDSTFSESSETVGSFEFSPDADPWHTINCSSYSDSATQNDAVDTINVTFYWRAPPTPTTEEEAMTLPNITFWYTIAESYFSYFFPLPGPQLTPNPQSCSAPGLSCEPDEFRCTVENCIPLRDFCDGEDDCGDNSDETAPTCSDPELAISPEALFEGDNVTFFCAPYRPELPPVLEFRAAGSQNNFSSILSFFPGIDVTNTDGGTEFVLVVDRTLTGAEVRCSVGARVSESITLTIYYPPTYTDIAPVSALTGDFIAISLQLDAFPFPDEVAWYFNGEPLEQDNVEYGVAYITFMNVRLEQSGMYRVETSNLAGTGTTSFQLIITDFVTCQNGDIRLVNGSSELEGRVEVCYNNQWGTVCGDSWDSTDAAVVCRQLGFSPFGATTIPIALFGQGLGPILLDDVNCSGGETMLIDCSLNGIGNNSCDHSTDAGVRCQDGISDCACSQGIECSIIGEFTSGSTVRVTGNELKCTISLDAINEDSVRIDPSFETDFQYLSAGSLALGRQLNVVPRDEGFKPCEVEQELLQDSDPSAVLESLGVTAVSITYLQNDIFFANFNVGTSELRELAQARDFTVNGRLGVQNACSFQHLIYWLTVTDSFPAGSQCVDVDGSTNTVFTVEC